MKKHAVVLTMILGLLLIWSMPVFSADTAGGTGGENVNAEPYTVENVRSIDTNQDGVLDKSEIAADPKMYKYYGDKKAFQHADRNNDGVISVDEAKSQRQWQMKQNKPASKKEALEKIKDKKEDIRDKREDVKDSREDVKDRQEDIRDKREDIKDRQDNQIKAEQLSSLQNQLANTTNPEEQAKLQGQINRLQNNIARDKQEDIRDRREDVRDRKEDARDKREDVRDHREDRKDRKDRPHQHRPQAGQRQKPRK